MATKTILSGIKVKVRALQVDKSLRQVNIDAGLGVNYIYAALDSSSVQLSTIDKLASALDCNSIDLLDTIEAKATEDDELIAELKEIKARNDTNGTWLNSAEVRKKLLEADINVG